MGKSIEFSRPDGNPAPGYLAEPQRERAPGIVLFEEWWGVNDYIKGVAERLASEGFRVLIPDLFRGKVASSREEAGHHMEGLDFTDAATQDGAGAARFLKRSGEKVGVMGFCMGGALAMLCAMHVSEFDACVTNCGFPPPEAGDPGLIKIPIQGHWAIHDEFFPIAQVDKLEERLKAGRVPYEFFRYDAKHAFFNSDPHGLGHYRPDEAEKFWKHALAFFRRALRSDDRTASQ